MLIINPEAFNAATEALMIAARSVTDAAGLKMSPNMPSCAARDIGLGIMDTTDYGRIRAIVLGAVVSLVGGAAYPGDEHHFIKFVSFNGGSQPRDGDGVQV